jgi:phage/plasmid-associated DNA primase
LLSDNPFEASYQDYLDKGWLGPMALPYRMKEPPQTGVTGHIGKYPVPEQFKKWLKLGKQNIALALREIGSDFQLVALDVDSGYPDKSGRIKEGWQTLQDLEAKLGTLPATWICSARAAGGNKFSGQRFFKMSAEFYIRKDAGTDIECISRGHRYSVVFPSLHPNGEMYCWYKSDVDGTVDIASGEVSVPNVNDLPELPDAWVDYLTQGKTTKIFKAEAMDTNSSIPEIVQWAENTFYNFSGEVCRFTQQQLDRQLAKIAQGGDAHKPLVNAHYELLNLALEGHHGINTAIDIYEEEWKNLVDQGQIGSNDRDSWKTDGEIKRSYNNALRTVKGKSDEQVKVGANPVWTCCKRLEKCPEKVGDKTLVEYERNDDGNAEHLCDRWRTEEESDIRYVSDDGKDGVWIIWDQENNRWIRDSHEIEINGCWASVRTRQNTFLRQLETDLGAEMRNALGMGINPKDHPPYMEAKSLYDKWGNFLVDSGNLRRSEAAIRKARKRVAIDSSSVDANKRLLGVANGVIQFDERGWKMLKQDEIRREDFITMNTNVPVLPESELDPIVLGMWNNFINKALPTERHRKMAQMVAGYMLFGGNPGRHGIFIVGASGSGKSTWANIGRKAMGDYGGAFSKNVYLNRPHKPELIKAEKKRFIVSSEFDSTTKASSGVFKELTGGTDDVNVEKKGVDEEKTVDPHFTMIIPTNAMPQFSDFDLANKNRVYALDFNVVFNEGELSDLINSKEKSHEVWLSYALKGYEMLCDHGGGLYNDEETVSFVNEITSGIDIYQLFIDECITLHALHKDTTVTWDYWKHDYPEYCTGGQFLYQYFRDWMRNNGYHERDWPTKHLFTRKIGEKLEIKQTKKPQSMNSIKDRYWVGLSVYERDNVIRFRQV